MTFKAEVPDVLNKYGKGVHYLGFIRSEIRIKDESFDLVHDIKFSYDFDKGKIIAKVKTANKREAEEKVKDFLKSRDYI